MINHCDIFYIKTHLPNRTNTIDRAISTNFPTYTMPLFKTIILQFKTNQTLSTDQHTFYKKLFKKYGIAISKYGTSISKYGIPVSKYGIPVSKYGTSVSKYGTSVSKYKTSLASMELLLASMELPLASMELTIANMTLPFR